MSKKKKSHNRSGLSGDRYQIPEYLLTAFGEAPNHNRCLTHIISADPPAVDETQPALDNPGSVSKG